MAQQGHGYWVHRGSPCTPVSMRTSTIGSFVVPCSYGYKQVHSLSRPLLLRAPSARCLLVSFDASATCQDSDPLSTSPHRVHMREAFHDLASFRPQVLSTSRRLTPLCDPRACFIPQPSPGLFSVQGFVHPAQRSALFELLCPLAVGSRRLTRKRMAGNLKPRPRGFAPRGAAYREVGN
jgi:hypothetical protein